MGKFPAVVLFSMNEISLQYGLTATWYLYLYLVEILFVINPRLFATVHVKARAEYLVSLHFVASQSFFFEVVYNFAVSWKTAVQLHTAVRCQGASNNFNWGWSCFQFDRTSRVNRFQPCSSHLIYVRNFTAASCEKRYDLIEFTLGRQYVISAKTRFEHKKNRIRW